MATYPITKKSSGVPNATVLCMCWYFHAVIPTKSDQLQEGTLTVVHLQDTMFTLEIRRQIVAHFDVVPLVGVPIVVIDVSVDPLAILPRNARGRHVVPAGVVGVYRAVVVVIGGAGQRVPVETFLLWHATALHPGGVAD